MFLVTLPLGAYCIKEFLQTLIHLYSEKPFLVRFVLYCSYN